MDFVYYLSTLPSGMRISILVFIVIAIACAVGGSENTRKGGSGGSGGGGGNTGGTPKPPMS